MRHRVLVRERIHVVGQRRVESVEEVSHAIELPDGAAGAELLHRSVHGAVRTLLLELLRRRRLRHGVAGAGGATARRALPKTAVVGTRGRVTVSETAGGKASGAAEGISLPGGERRVAH